jgi:hypothetical protein
MIYAALFVGGTFFGLVLAAIGVIIALRWEPPKRERPIYSVNGGRHTRTTGPETPFEILNRVLR